MTDTISKAESLERELAKEKTIRHLVELGVNSVEATNYLDKQEITFDRVVSTGELFIRAGARVYPMSKIADYAASLRPQIINSDPAGNEGRTYDPVAAGKEAAAVAKQNESTRALAFK